MEEGICNQSWAALVTTGRAYEGDKIPAWDGSHDDHEWTPEQLTLIANRVEQIAELVPILRDLAANGGVRIS